MRGWIIGAATFLAMVAGAAGAAPKADAKWGDGGVSPFYTWTGPAPTKPGVILRSEPLAKALGLPEAASGVRILYSATDGVAGQGVLPVSGAYFTPKGAAPRGGWPLVAWAHGTVGMADVCAPSFAGRSDRDIRYLNAWLKAGYAVVSTDYQGLGTPGPHAYIFTRPEAYSVLDSARAVLASQKRLSGQVLIVGQSQGAGAAFATAALAGTYAPELKIAATVATGTPYISAKTLAALAGGDQARVDPTLAYAFYLALTAQQGRPDLKLSDLFTEAALPIAEGARTQCIGPLEAAIVAAKLTRGTTLKPGALETVLGPDLPAYGYATLKLKAPIFMGAGQVDRDVPAPGQLLLAKDACAAGTVVEAHLYAGLDHSGAVNGSLGDSLPFAKKALAGEPIAPRCSPAPQPPSPAPGVQP